jgi:predicted PurR-regulated permease PerM
MKTVRPGARQEPDSPSIRAHAREKREYVVLRIPGLRTLALAILLAFGIWILLRLAQQAMWVLVLVLVAIILATALAPIVAFIRRAQFPPGGWRIPKAAAVVLVYLVGFAALGLLVYLVGSGLARELTALIGSLPLSGTSLAQQLRDTAESAGVPAGVLPAPQDIDAQLQSLAGQGLSTVRAAGGTLTGFLGSLAGFLVKVVIVLMLTLFLIVETDHILKFWVGLFPADQHGRVREVSSRMGHRMGLWLLGQLTVATIVGLLGGGIALLLGLPYPVLFGVTTALLDLIPTLGPALMVVPAVLTGLSQSVLIAVLAGALFLLLSQLDGQVLSPLITGHVVKLSPASVIVAIPIGLALYGPIGALIAVPIAASLHVVVCEVVVPWVHRQETDGARG